ncbi:MAG: hypothetical protein IJG63_08095, partial [Oscillospiraceae bacterium]|nr:hypothetical protein [Oscillospiraceae bacterium]
MKHRKILYLLLVCVLAFCLLGVTAAADDGATEYNLWVGGVRVTSDNASDVLKDGKVRFAVENGENILYLNGTTITGVYEVSQNYKMNIYAEFINLTVVLSGDNRLQGGTCGIQCTGMNDSAGNLTIRGSGSLTCEATNKGINPSYNATITGNCRVNISGAEDGIYSPHIASIKIAGESTVHITNCQWGITALYGTVEITDDAVLVAEGSAHAVLASIGITLGEDIRIVEPEGGEIGQLSEGGNYYIISNGASVKRAAIGKEACNVAAGVDPTGGGTVTGAKKYVKRDDAVLSAEPATGYKFVNWTENGSAVSTDNPYTFTVTKDRNLVANFEKQTFMVSFVNYDGKELQSSAVAYGDTPSYVGDTPTKAASAQYTYSFAGWSPEIVPVTQATVYTATYNSELRKYTVKFVNYDGEELQSSAVAYGDTPSYVGEP